MLAAIRIGLLEGCQEFRIYGGMGGRLEHTLANLQCLIYLKQCSAVGYLMDDKTTAFVMQNETVWFKPEAKGFPKASIILASVSFTSSTGMSRRDFKVSSCSSRQII